MQDYLNLLCPGIDANDTRKSMVTLQYIATYAFLIPFVDFSGAADHHKLTDQQHQIRSVILLGLQII